MKAINIKHLVAALGVAVVFFGNVAQASLLSGNTVRYQYHFPTITTNYSNAANGNYVVGAGIEVSNVADNTATLDLSDTNLYVDFATSGGWTSTTFNGFEIFDVLSGIDAFTGVSINSATNLAGFNASRISFDADHIWVNWQGLNFEANTVVSLDISGGNNVPEPESLALVCLALAGLRLTRRKAKQA